MTGGPDLPDKWDYLRGQHLAALVGDQDSMAATELIARFLSARDSAHQNMYEDRDAGQHFQEFAEDYRAEAGELLDLFGQKVTDGQLENFDVGAALFGGVRATGGTVPQLFFFDGEDTLFLIQADRDGIADMREAQRAALLKLVRDAMTTIVRINDEEPT